MGFHGLLRNSFTFLYVHDNRTSQETRMDLTASYGDSFTSLYVEDDRTSQDTHL
jgi:hypothetical protein